MAPFDETPAHEEDEDLPLPDLGALLGGALGGDDDDEDEEDPLATDSLDALRDEESGDDTDVDPARAAVLEASGEDDDDDIEDLEELERDGFGRERDFGFDAIDDDEEDEDDDYDDED